MANGSTGIFRGLALAGLSMFAVSAYAIQPNGCEDGDLTSTECGPATPGLSCAFSRGATGCTANDFVGTANATSNTISSCQLNEILTGQDVVLTLSSGMANRYDTGLFIGEDGKSPQVNPATTGAQTCSVRTFPNSPAPWTDLDTDGDCGDYPSGQTSIDIVKNVTLKCLPDANGNLAIPFTVVYSQNGNATCGGPADVAPGTSSKCSGGNVPVTNVTVTYNADPGCSGKTVTYDAGAGTITSTFTLVNNDPNNGTPGQNADGTTFEDNLDNNAPPTVTVTNVTCTSNDGAVATCGFTGNDVTGTVTTFPSGSHVLVTITGTVPGGNMGTYSNTATLTPPANLTAGVDATGNNLCSNSTTLPVKLQSFDVH